MVVGVKVEAPVSGAGSRIKSRVVSLVDFGLCFKRSQGANRAVKCEEHIPSDETGSKRIVK